MRRKRIVLHGRVSAFIDIYDSGRINSVGLPKGSLIYAVTHKGKPVLCENAAFDEIAGIVVIHAGNVIAEGRTGHTVGSNAEAKLLLSQQQNTHSYKSKGTEHSEALKEILERAEKVFAPIEVQKEKAETKDKQSFNPFYEMYPDSEWKKVQHKHDRAYHLKGTVHIADKVLSVTAVPVSFYSEQAFIKDGFTKVATGDDGMLYRMRVTRT